MILYSCICMQPQTVITLCIETDTWKRPLRSFNNQFAAASCISCACICGVLYMHEHPYTKVAVYYIPIIKINYYNK